MLREGGNYTEEVYRNSEENKGISQSSNGSNGTSLNCNCTSHMSSNYVYKRTTSGRVLTDNNVLDVVVHLRETGFLLRLKERSRLGLDSRGNVPKSTPMKS